MKFICSECFNESPIRRYGVMCKFCLGDYYQDGKWRVELCLECSSWGKNRNIDTVKNHEISYHTSLDII